MSLKMFLEEITFKLVDEVKKIAFFKVIGHHLIQFFLFN
jgi:hypothetical protein